MAIISLYVGNLPADITKDELVSYFKTFGNCYRTYISVSKDGNHTFGFIRYDNIDSATNAVLAMDNSFIRGKLIDVSTSNENRDAEEIRERVKRYVTNKRAIMAQEVEQKKVKNIYKVLAIKQAICAASELCQQAALEGLDLSDMLTSISRTPARLTTPTPHTPTHDTESIVKQICKFSSEQNLMSPLIKYPTITELKNKNKLLSDEGAWKKCVTPTAAVTPIQHEHESVSTVVTSPSKPTPIANSNRVANVKPRSRDIDKLDKLLAHSNLSNIPPAHSIMPSIEDTGPPPLLSCGEVLVRTNSETSTNCSTDVSPHSYHSLFNNFNSDSKSAVLGTSCSSLSSNSSRSLNGQQLKKPGGRGHKLLASINY